MSSKKISVQEALVIFELTSGDDSAPSNNSDDYDKDDFENFSQRENISSSSDAETDEIQRPSTIHIPVKTEGGLYKRCAL
ncbi:hypothetical protein TNCV_4434991 [Trichonephila clavipes]|nr:hypothetical protein TNCV_4434991 [Trichonephila clavipes]